MPARDRDGVLAAVLFAVYVVRLRPRRLSFRAPRAPEAQVARDVRFGVGPNDRDLLCDVWEPAEGTPRSGLAIVYLHGSAWTLLDKDVGTRAFFRHLAARGHVIMNVAYRLCPETDIVGMVGDAKRAIAWMKARGARDVVLMGASAGAHIALLAAYTPGHPRLTPADVTSDTSVRAVISYYGIPDMRDYDASTRCRRRACARSSSSTRGPVTRSI